MIDGDTIQHILKQCTDSGVLLPELLVREDLISDWEVSRVCSELFHLPYLPVDCYPPADDARAGLDPEYLRANCLVPLDRFGELITVAMPGIVPTAILDGLCGNGISQISPVVGSIAGNRMWLDANIQTKEAKQTAKLEEFSAAISDSEASWANIFDAGDDAVQLGLQDEPEADLDGGDDFFGDLEEVDDLVDLSDLDEEG